MSFKIMLDGKSLNYDRVVELKAGMDLEEAHKYVTSHSQDDGLDTYGLRTADRDLLVVGQGFNTSSAIFRPDRFTVNGAPAEIRFVENEPNSWKERFRPIKAVKSTGEVGGSLSFILGLVGALLSIGHGLKGLVASSIVGLLTLPTIILVLDALDSLKPGSVRPGVITQIAK